MPANLTEGSSPANQTMPMLDASPVACTEIATFTEVLAAEEWGSFYSSFKDTYVILHIVCDLCHLSGSGNDVPQRQDCHLSLCSPFEQLCLRVLQDGTADDPKQGACSSLPWKHLVLYFLCYKLLCFFQTEQLITLWVLFVFTIVGNSVVLFSTWRRKRKSRMTFFVTQLAITDSFTGLINILTEIIWRFTGDFMAPDLVCRVVRYFQVVLLYASTYVLVSLSIDRYHAIVYPMKFLQGEKQAKVLIGIAWSLAFLFSVPTLFIFGKRTLANGEVQCWALWPDDSYWTPYMTIVAFLVYFIPLTIISVIYGLVIRTIWIKSKAQETVISNCLDGKLCSSYNRGLISRAKIKAIKYSIVIILAFICCWSPYFLFDMLDNFNLLPDTKERFYASVIIQNLPALNSAINPLIYCVFSSSICFPCKEQRPQDSRMTYRERSERQEMQILSKPEFI